MLRRIATLIAVAVSALSVFAQQPDQLFTATKNQLAVTKIVLAQEAAWNKGDFDGFVNYYKDAPDTVAMIGGPVRGLANIRSAFHIAYPGRESMGHLEQTEVEARELGENFAMVTGKYHLARSKKGGGDAEGGFTEVFEKTPTGWLVIFSENT